MENTWTETAHQKPESDYSSVLDFFGWHIFTATIPSSLSVPHPVNSRKIPGKFFRDCSPTFFVALCRFGVSEIVRESIPVRSRRRRQGTQPSPASFSWSLRRGPGKDQFRRQFHHLISPHVRVLALFALHDDSERAAHADIEHGTDGNHVPGTHSFLNSIRINPKLRRRSCLAPGIRRVVTTRRLASVERSMYLSFLRALNFRAT
jgi:hypothetical protein